MQEVNDQLKKYNCLRRTERPNTKVAELEKMVDFNLPDDYLNFALNYSGFEEFIGPEFVRTMGL